MIFILWNGRKLRVFCRSAGKELQCHAADGFCSIQIDRNADIARKRLILILGQVDAVSGIIDKIVSIDPCLTPADRYLQTAACSKEPKAVAVVILNAVANDTGQIIIEILRCVGAVKVL